jgi:hypothetical protein
VGCGLHETVSNKRNGNLMIYKNIEFSVVQGIEPGVWKWSVSISESEVKIGQAKTKSDAVIAAWRAIDKAEPKKHRFTSLATSPVK